MKIYKNKRMEAKIKSTYDELIEQWDTPVCPINLVDEYGTTHINRFGDPKKEPLVLFHGVGDDSALMWIYNAKELGKYFDCYAVDTIGGPGKSIPGVGYNKTFDDMAWIDHILDQIGLEQVYMAGVSNGAYLTQAYMMLRLERVKRGVSLAGTVPISTGKSVMGTMLKIFLPEALIPTDKNVVRLIKKMTGSNDSVFTENPLVFEHFKELMVGFRRNAMMNHKIMKFTRDQVLGIKSRCLYIVGEKDPFISLGGGELLKKLEMNVKWIKDAGHGINHECAREVEQYMISYLLGE